MLSWCAARDTWKWLPSTTYQTMLVKMEINGRIHQAIQQTVYFDQKTNVELRSETWDFNQNQNSIFLINILVFYLVELYADVLTISPTNKSK